MKKFKEEFVAFVSKGNVLDLAVGVIIGGAFGKIVTSFVNDILMPLIGLASGGHNFSALNIKINNAVIAYGMFIQNIIDFLIIALCIFMFIKLITRLKKLGKDSGKDVPPTEHQKEEIILLTEIRDLLQNKKN